MTESERSAFAADLALLAMSPAMDAVFSDPAKPGQVVLSAALKPVDGLTVEQINTRAAEQRAVAANAGARPVPSAPTIVKRPDAKPKPKASSPPPEPDIVAFPGPARFANVTVRIVRVERGHVPLVNRAAASGRDRNGESVAELLSVHVEVANCDETRPLDYTSFQGRGFSRDDPGLVDEARHAYQHIHFGPSVAVAGRTEIATIDPGKAITDRLVFERPLARAAHLVLDLPAAHAGQPAGVFRFRIPMAAMAPAK